MDTSPPNVDPLFSPDHEEEVKDIAPTMDGVGLGDYRQRRRALYCAARRKLEEQGEPSEWAHHQALLEARYYERKAFAETLDKLLQTFPADLATIARDAYVEAYARRLYDIRRSGKSWREAHHAALHTMSDGDLPPICAWMRTAVGGLCPEARDRIGHELNTHMRQAVDEYISVGLDKDTAVDRACADLGDPREAKRRYERVYLTTRETYYLDHTRRLFPTDILMFAWPFVLVVLAVGELAHAGNVWAHGCAYALTIVFGLMVVNRIWIKWHWDKSNVFARGRARLHAELISLVFATILALTPMTSDVISQSLAISLKMSFILFVLLCAGRTFDAVSTYRKLARAHPASAPSPPPVKE